MPCGATTRAPKLEPGILPLGITFKKLPLTCKPSETWEGMWCLAAPLFVRLLGPGFNTDQAEYTGGGAS